MATAPATTGAPTRAPETILNTLEHQRQEAQDALYQVQAIVGGIDALFDSANVTLDLPGGRQLGYAETLCSTVQRLLETALTCLSEVEGATLTLTRGARA